MPDLKLFLVLRQTRAAYGCDGETQLGFVYAADKGAAEKVTARENDRYTTITVLGQNEFATIAVEKADLYEG